jgi:hypothetical protein
MNAQVRCEVPLLHRYGFSEIQVTGAIQEQRDRKTTDWIERSVLRVGFEDVRGYLERGLAEWESGALKFGSLATIDVATIKVEQLDNQLNQTARLSKSCCTVAKCTLAILINAPRGRKSSCR